MHQVFYLLISVKFLVLYILVSSCMPEGSIAPESSKSEIYQDYSSSNRRKQVSNYPHKAIEMFNQSNYQGLSLSASVKFSSSKGKFDHKAIAFAPHFKGGQATYSFTGSHKFNFLDRKIYNLLKSYKVEPGIALVLYDQFGTNIAVSHSGSYSAEGKNFVDYSIYITNYFGVDALGNFRGRRLSNFRITNVVLTAVDTHAKKLTVQYDKDSSSASVNVDLLYRVRTYIGKKKDDDADANGAIGVSTKKKYLNVPRNPWITVSDVKNGDVATIKHDVLSTDNLEFILKFEGEPIGLTLKKEQDDTAYFRELDFIKYTEIHNKRDAECTLNQRILPKINQALGFIETELTAYQEDVNECNTCSQKDKDDLNLQLKKINITLKILKGMKEMVESDIEKCDSEASNKLSNINKMIDGLNGQLNQIKLQLRSKNLNGTTSMLKSKTRSKSSLDYKYRRPSKKYSGNR